MAPPSMAAPAPVRSTALPAAARCSLWRQAAWRKFSTPSRANRTAANPGDALIDVGGIAVRDDGERRSPIMPARCSRSQRRASWRRWSIRSRAARTEVLRSEGCAMSAGKPLRHHLQWRLARRRHGLLGHARRQGKGSACLRRVRRRRTARRGPDRHRRHVLRHDRSRRFAGSRRRILRDAVGRLYRGV